MQEAQDSKVAVRRRAMDLLARREHAPKELAQKLISRGFPESLVFEALEQLIEDNLLSVTRYAHSLVRARVSRGIGPVRIRRDLKQMDVSAAIISQALKEEGTDWFALAQQVRTKRFGPQRPEHNKERAKQMRFLRQRGFDFDCIHAALDAN